MSQNDFTLANQSFPAFRADLNSALQALASNNSGTSAPSTTFANMWWYDSTNNIMYIRNEDNDAWIKFAELDQTNDKFVLSGTLQLDDGTVSAPALTFNSDTNMGIYRGGTDILKFVTAGADRLTILANGDVGIGTSPSHDLHVKSDGNTKVKFEGNLNSNTSDLLLSHSSTGDSGLQFNSNQLNMFTYGDMTFNAGTGNVSGAYPANERMRIKNTGVNVGIGNTFAHSFNAQANQLVVGTGSGDNGITIYSGSGSGDTGNLFFADGFNASDETRAGIVYDHGTNTMNFRVNDAPKMYLLSSGNLGIGMSNPSQKLDVRGTVHLGVSGTSSGDVTGTLSIGNTGTNYMTLIKAINDASTPAILRTRMGFFTLSGVGEEASHATEKVSILADSGNTGIGTTVPGEKLSINGNMRLQTGMNPVRIQYFNGTGTYSVGSSGGASISFHDVSGSQEISFETHHVGSSHAERVRISKEGNLLVGCTALPSGGAGGAGFEAGQSSGRTILQLGTTTTSQITLQRFYNPNGNVGEIKTSGSSTIYAVSSDHRLKENVTSDWDATTRIKELNPVRFNFIADADTTVDGFLAHEVQSVVPEAITGTHNEVDANGNPVYQGIDQSKLVPLLVKTIQELEARITALETA